MPIPAEITPREHLRVFDLVREAGVDVSDWKNFAKGAAHEASNPKYCYEWSFLQPGRVVVLKLWHDKLIESNGHIEQHLNLIADARKEPTGSRVKRREHMRQAIHIAIDGKLPIRVIVMKARPPRITKTGKKTRTVDHQILDPLPWAVVSGEANGGIVLRRGAPTAPYVDQYDCTENADATPKKKDVPAGSVFVRDPSVRRRVLAVAMGLCELCKQPGFQLPNGSVYLETHHVIPLSEGGPDSVDNVVAICPNDHREAHHGKLAGDIRTRLLDVIGKRRS
ncbi:HNH endonuclease [Paucibacter sp. M5-1]|uniref:HNH endonuclease n=1 Tax=Paucibacter sp. M5-1 TaxID=3015998 RepID=UPI0022B8881F|nr:HNH endonuclease [Paucibacter sp. M5-1]MCZ7881926.1 HNH endonuclease [Paucibacter sp. M5-1]